MKKYNNFNKKKGKDLIHKASDMGEVEWLSTGIKALDYVMGGGLPKGRMVSIKGLQSVAKTSLSLSIIANAQKEGVPCVFVDAEWSLDLTHANNLGVDLDQLIVISPDMAEEAIEALETTVDEEMLIVVDSVAALSARAEAESTINEPGIALQARLMSRALRKLTPLLAKTNSIIIWINQYRHNLMGGPYNPYTETGGAALKFYTSVGLDLKRGNVFKEKERVKGQEVKVSVIKNKVGPPGGKCVLEFLFEEGFTGKVPILESALEEGWITKEGRTYYYQGEKIATSKDEAEQYINDNLLT